MKILFGVLGALLLASSACKRGEEMQSDEARRTMGAAAGQPRPTQPPPSQPAPPQQSSAPSDARIRPFRVDIPEQALVDLRQRVAATRWPDRETVNDQSQSVRLAKIQELVRYWGTDYDWRRFEASLNALPQFVTNIDGVDLHFVHVRSRHPNALPLIMTHGWPGSIVELMKVIGPLTDPTAYGGRAEDAFDLVLPLVAWVRLLGMLRARAPGHWRAATVSPRSDRVVAWSLAGALGLWSLGSAAKPLNFRAGGRV